jgi:cytochrome d ubiquinol oxidase subunit I
VVTHWLFVALTLGLVTFVVILQTMWYRTGNPVYGKATRFWGQLYVINYAVGIATGIVMEFQFGLNWAGLTHFIGNVIGTPMALETMIAFFLESTFLGMWIFGWNIVSRRVHLYLIWATAISAWFSVFWVLMANSFLQNPVGQVIENGRAVLGNFWELLGNWNFWLGGFHASMAAASTGGVFILGVSAWHMRRLAKDDERREMYVKSFKLALYIAPVTLFWTAFMGGRLFDLIKKEQPVKGQAANDHLDIAQNLAQSQWGNANYTPPGAGGHFIYISDEIMTWAGIIMLSVIVTTALLTIKGWFWRTPVAERIALRIIPWLIPLPFIAGVFGWFFREIGRQPWVVYGLLKTEDAVSPGRTPTSALISLVVFAVLVASLAVTDWLLLNRYAKRGPDFAQLGGDGQLSILDVDWSPARRSDEGEGETVLEGSYQ